MRWFAWSVIACMAVCTLSCSKQTTTESTTAQASKPVEEKIAMETAKITPKAFTEPQAATVDPAKQYMATIKTNRGDITVELNAKEAPLSVTNFLQLAQGGFYNGLTFHRVEPGFVIQGGDPEGTGRGGPGYTIPAEIGLKHTKGALAWARLGDQVNPERRSSGSQFYITLAPTPFLDSGYTVFGQTTAGLDVVEQIQVGDKILGVEVVEK